MKNGLFLYKKRSDQRKETFERCQLVLAFKEVRIRFLFRSEKQWYSKRTQYSEGIRLKKKGNTYGITCSNYS